MRLLILQDATLDSSGRLSIPAKLRTWFNKSVVFSLARDYRYISLYPVEAWERVEERLAPLAATNPQVDRLKARLATRTVDARIDSAWRVLLPEWMRLKVGIKNTKVKLVGLFDKLTIWSPDRWEQMERELASDAELDALEDQYNL